MLPSAFGPPAGVHLFFRICAFVRTCLGLRRSSLANRGACPLKNGFTFCCLCYSWVRARSRRVVSHRRHLRSSSVSSFWLQRLGPLSFLRCIRRGLEAFV